MLDVNILTVLAGWNTTFSFCHVHLDRLERRKMLTSLQMQCCQPIKSQKFSHFEIFTPL